MVDPNSIQNSQNPLQGIGKTSSGAPANDAASAENGVAFRALLDQLQSQVHGLQKTGETVDNPDELAGAVDQARTSLKDALALKDQLVESYRAAQQRSESGGDKA